MIDQNDNNTSDTPEGWEHYGSMLRGLPERNLPEGFSARLNAAVPPRGATASRRRTRMWWIIAPATTLATVLLVVWLGTLNFSVNQVENHRAVAKAPAGKTQSRVPRAPKNRTIVKPVAPQSDFPAPPDVAAAPAGLDSMTGSLHKQEVSTPHAVTGAPSTSYARGSMAVLVQ